MSRYGLFGSNGPGRNRLDPSSSPYDDPFSSHRNICLDPAPTNGLLSALIDPTPPRRHSTNALSIADLLLNPPPPPQAATNRLLSALMRLHQPEPQAIGTVIVGDGQINYTFAISSIDDPPDVLNADYIFGSDGRWIWYVGKTKDTGTRFCDHRKLEAAKVAGATEIWIHVPGPNAYVDYHDAEVRLIRRWKPPLNDIQYDAA
jgi:hypothetical protein